MTRLTTGLEYMYGLEEGMYILIRHGHVLAGKFWIFHRTVISPLLTIFLLKTMDWNILRGSQMGWNLETFYPNF